MNAATLQAVPPADAPAPEEAARAEFYALLAGLFYQPPEADLLAAIAAAAPIPALGDGLALAEAWDGLREAARKSDPERVRDEYDALFITAGQAPVMLYGSFHIAGFLHETPLAELRSDLARLGFSRRPGVGEPEDHIAALCEVMRLMIATRAESLAAQREFFGRHIRPWYGKVLRQLEAEPQADFYRGAGRFARAFFEIESQSFDME